MAKKQIEPFHKYHNKSIKDEFDRTRIVCSEEIKEGVKLRICDESHSLFTVGHKITDNSDAEGGQGVVFNTSISKNIVVKIFYAKERTRYIEEKVKFICNYKFNDAGICWPISAVETLDGEFVGFVMPRVEGRPLDILANGRKKNIDKVFPIYTRTTQIQVIINILKQFKKLHDLNILVGDVKLENILVKPNTEVTLIDMDSIQIDKYYCGQATPGYDSPDFIEYVSTRTKIKSIHETRDGIPILYFCYSKKYRDLKYEYHALAVVIYRLLMRSFPYNSSDLEEKDFNRLNDEYNDDIDIDLELAYHRMFCYSNKEKEISSKCQEQEIWSHFPSFLKIAFVNCFKKGKYLSVEEWLDLFNLYLEKIENGQLKKLDSDYNNPFPKGTIDYLVVDIKKFDSVEQVGFSWAWTIALACNKTKDKDLLNIIKNPSNITSIINGLKENVKVQIGDYKFSIIYNIGIIKKIKIEPK